MSRSRDVSAEDRGSKPGSLAARDPVAWAIDVFARRGAQDVQLNGRARHMPCSRREKDENADHDRTLLGLQCFCQGRFWFSEKLSPAAVVVRLDVSAAANGLLVTISGHAPRDIQ